MPLSDTVIRQLKLPPSPLKLFDGRGLFLLVTPEGHRRWRLKYRMHGKEKLLALGIYPDVSLKLARDRREQARQLIAEGIDPSAKRQAEKAARSDTFEAIAREWLGLQEQSLSPATFKKAKWTFETLIFPQLGQLPIASIKAPDLLATLRKIEARGKFETTHRAKQRCGQIFRYAIATGRAEHDVSSDLRGRTRAGRHQESRRLDGSGAGGRAPAGDRRLPRQSDHGPRSEARLEDFRATRRAEVCRVGRD